MKKLESIIRSLRTGMPLTSSERLAVIGILEAAEATIHACRLPSVTSGAMTKFHHALRILEAHIGAAEALTAERRVGGAYEAEAALEGWARGREDVR